MTQQCHSQTHAREIMYPNQDRYENTGSLSPNSQPQMSNSVNIHHQETWQIWVGAAYACSSTSWASLGKKRKRRRKKSERKIEWVNLEVHKYRKRCLTTKAQILAACSNTDTSWTFHWRNSQPPRSACCPVTQQFHFGVHAQGYLKH